jgi:hypothetical protein
MALLAGAPALLLRLAPAAGQRDVAPAAPAAPLAARRARFAAGAAASPVLPRAPRRRVAAAAASPAAGRLSVLATVAAPKPATLAFPRGTSWEVHKCVRRRLRGMRLAAEAQRRWPPRRHASSRLAAAPAGRCRC